MQWRAQSRMEERGEKRREKRKDPTRTPFYTWSASLLPSTSVHACTLHSKLFKQNLRASLAWTSSPTHLVESEVM